MAAAAFEERNWAAQDPEESSQDSSRRPRTRPSGPVRLGKVLERKQRSAAPLATAAPGAAQRQTTAKPQESGRAADGDPCATSRQSRPKDSPAQTQGPTQAIICQPAPTSAALTDTDTSASASDPNPLTPGRGVVSGAEQLQRLFASLAPDDDPDSLKLDPVKERAFQSAKNSASGMISRRPHSRHMLETKLADRGHEAEAIKAAIDRLEEVGLQSDAEYAEVYTRSKWRQARWAPSRIKMELRRQGVSNAHIRKGLAEVFGEDLRLHIDLLEVMEQDEEVDMFGTERDNRSDRQLLEAARKQASFTEGLPIEARRRRMVGWLQRRGHDWDTTSKLLQLLDLK